MVEFRALRQRADGRDQTRTSSVSTPLVVVQPTRFGGAHILASAPDPVQDRQSRGMQARIPIYAHRLGGGYGPEASRAALEHTLSQPVDGLEADVVLSADDEVIVLHDPDLSISTDLTGWARELRTADLIRARILNSAGEPSDQNPMLLTELLERIPSGLPLQVDVKAYVDLDLVQRTVERACAALHEHGTAERAEILSFFTPGCVTAVAHGVAARLVTWSDYAPPTLAEWALGHGLVGVAFEGFIFSRKLREAMTAASLSAQVGTINEPSQLARIIPLSPDIIASDCPHEIAAELARLSQRSIASGAGAADS